jgi:lysophospholipase L1-like esterase
MILCAGAGFAAGRGSQNIDYDAAYIHQRAKVLTEEAQREEAGHVLLVGDSISERSGVHQLCGRDVFNVGISGAKLSDMHDLAIQLAEATKPSRVFVAIGTNDAKAADATDAAEWAREYTAMVRNFAPTPVVLVPAPVIEPGKQWSSEFSEASLARLNALLPAIAKATGARILSRPVVETADGVHPTKKGAADWRAPLKGGCA